MFFIRNNSFSYFLRVSLKFSLTNVADEDDVDKEDIDDVGVVGEILIKSGENEFIWSLYVSFSFLIMFNKFSLWNLKFIHLNFLF